MHIFAKVRVPDESGWKERRRKVELVNRAAVRIGGLSLKATPVVDLEWRLFECGCGEERCALLHRAMVREKDWRRLLSKWDTPYPSVTGDWLVAGKAKTGLMTLLPSNAVVLEGEIAPVRPTATVRQGFRYFSSEVRISEKDWQRLLAEART